MSAAEPLTGYRVLVISQAAPVLETVLAELTELGITARGTTEPDEADRQYSGADLDLVAFGGCVPEATAERLRRSFTRQQPSIRVLRTSAPRAVREISAALSPDPAPWIELDAYCERIGYDGPCTPTLETLQALHRLHPDAIPFEAIDVLLGRGIDLAPAAVDAKLIHGHRGGYCFEHNTLFERVLSATGFQVERLLGRVLWNAPAGAPPGPRTHMTLRVTIDSVPWLADVGFGAVAPTAPLRMDTAEPQATDHEMFRVFPLGDQIRVQAWTGDRWRSLYELSPEPQLEADLEPANWYTATHPHSAFRTELYVTRATPSARYALSGTRLTTRLPDGHVAEECLDVAGIERALDEVFHLPVAPEWRALIERAYLRSADDFTARS